MFVAPHTAWSHIALGASERPIHALVWLAKASRKSPLGRRARGPMVVPMMPLFGESDLMLRPSALMARQSRPVPAQSVPVPGPSDPLLRESGAMAGAVGPIPAQSVPIAGELAPIPAQSAPMVRESALIVGPEGLSLGHEGSSFVAKPLRIGYLHGIVRFPPSLTP